MAMTKPAGYAMQVFSIPFLAVGFVVMLIMVMSVVSEPSTLTDNLPTKVGALIALAVGVWMLRAGKRAASPPSATAQRR